MYITEDGHLYATGQNNKGQLGFGDTTQRYKFKKVAENIVSVSCGHSYTMYITTEGHLYGTGANHSGEAGLGSFKYSDTFIKVAENIVSVSCGSNHSMYINDKGHLYATGGNMLGQLGLGKTKHICIFEKIAENIVSVSCGELHSMYITSKRVSGQRSKATGSYQRGSPEKGTNEEECLYATGFNRSGELGLEDNTNRDQFERINIE